MAKIYIEGTIKLVEDSSFKDAETKEKVPYFTNYIQDTEGGVVKLGSRENYEQWKDTRVVVVAEMKPDFNKPSLYRLKILEVKEN